MSRAVARVDVADESERDVVVLGLEPARAGDAAAHKRKLADDGLRQFKSGEQARHCGGFLSRAQRLPQIRPDMNQVGGLHER